MTSSSLLPVQHLMKSTCMLALLVLAACSLVFGSAAYYGNLRLNAFKCQYFVPVFGIPVDHTSDRETKGIHLIEN